MSQFLRDISRHLSHDPLRAEAIPLASVANAVDDRIVGTTPGMVVFKWNNRDCTGIDLHQRTLNEDVEAVKAMLDAEPHLLSKRFTYQTRFGDKLQEGSGEAIHLAVTRSSVALVRLLVERKAALDSMVTRDHKPHYDVLHAAVFSEGRGGQGDMIKCLLDAKAPATMNLDGHYPLHKAYQTGACAFDAIPILRADMEARGLLEDVESKYEGLVPTPLQLGIQMGKLTGEQLSQAASMTPVSLKIFIHDEPHSIPPFCERMQKEGFPIPAKDLAQYVTVKDLCKCLQEHPQAADVLLTALTCEPDIDNPGWHPLPTRMSFGPRGTFDRVRDVFNPPREFFATYQRASRWEFDAVSFRAPVWHDAFTGKFGRPSYDISLEVCLLPELASADFLSALAEADDDAVFQNKVTLATLDTVWWGGAYKVDILQLAITILGLVLLVTSRAFLDYDEIVQSSATERLLRPHGGGKQGQDVVRSTTEPLADAYPKMLPVAYDFIGARGIVDLVHELLQFGSYIWLGKGREYILNIGNLFDIARAALAITFCLKHEGNSSQAILIVIYWFRLLEVSFSEKLMRELLPITQLVKGLAPSSVVCLIAVCAFTHAKWVMEATPLWPDTFYDSFSLLITAGLPAETSTNFSLLYAYFAVSAFSVFFLNIFIGVIGENYTAEKEAAHLSLLKKKCGLCYTFLMRAKLLPCGLMSRRNADRLLAIGAAISLYTATTKLFAPGITPPCALGCFAVSQLMCLLACYQDPEEAWATNPHRDELQPRYMWVGMKFVAEPPSQENRIHQSLVNLHQKMRHMREAMTPLRCHPDGT